MYRKRLQDLAFFQTKFTNQIDEQLIIMSLRSSLFYEQKREKEEEKNLHVQLILKVNFIEIRFLRNIRGQQYQINQPTHPHDHAKQATVMSLYCLWLYQNQ